MGANLAIIGFADSIKTADKALKNANERGEQDRYENGHSYSGGIGMLHWRVVNRVFDTVDDFEKMFMDGGAYSDKGDGVIAQVRVIRETKPLKKLQLEFNNLEYDYKRQGPDGWLRRDEKKLTPAQYKRMGEKLEKVRTKYRALLAKQLAKSTKTRFIAGGWCAS